jgi:hypothetical protein
MRVRFVLAIACVFLCAGAARRRPALRLPALPVVDGVMSFSIVAVPDGARLTDLGGSSAGVDLGTVSRLNAGRSNVEVQPKATGFEVKTRFGILIRDPGARGRTASLLAAVTVPTRYTIKLDGVQLGPASRLVASALRPGALTTHRLEIQVPADAREDEAALMNAIQLTVVPE